MKVSDMLLEPQRTRPRISFTRIFAWQPVKTEDYGWVWLERVWRIDADGLTVAFSRETLPIGEVVCS